MTQAQLDKRNQYKLNLNSKQTQTDNLSEFYFILNDSKHCNVHFSEKHKDFILSLNINNSKNFNITKPMWKIFRQQISKIDHILNN